MGFSLLRLFQEFEEIFIKDISDNQKLLEIEELMKFQKQYAKECGQLGENV